MTQLELEQFFVNCDQRAACRDKYWLDIPINTQVYNSQVAQEQREQP